MKFGGQRDPSGAFVGHDASPAVVKNSLAYTLTRLGTDYVDLYQPARLDPQVPIEDTVGAIAEMIQAGYVRYIGLSEMGARDHPPGARRAPDRRAADRVLADEPRDRGGDPADRAGARHQRHRLRHLVPRPAEQRHRPAGPGDPRARFPRFQGENHARNLELLAALEQIAEDHGVTAAQLAIAWVASRGEDIIPLIGTKRRDRLAEALKALDLTLSARRPGRDRGRRAGRCGGRSAGPPWIASAGCER